MEIGFNLLSVRPDRPVGVDAFVRDVVGSIRATPTNRVRLAVRAEADETAILGRAFLENNQPVAVHRLNVRGMAHRIIVETLFLSRIFRNCDTVLSVNNFGPFWGRRGQRRLVVLHDLWFLSDRYRGNRVTRALFALLIRLQVRFTQEIITVSEYARREILCKLPLDARRVHVVPNCVGEGLGLTTSFADEDDRGQGPVAGPYLLLVGSDRPNKNVARALAAYRKFAGDRKGAPRVVVVGSYSTDFVQREGRRSGSRDAGVVEFRGFVSRSEYLTLMRESIGVAYPTIYEGFGIPVIEALAARKWVLVSKDTVCAELAGTSGIVVDGEDLDAISEGWRVLTERAGELPPQGDNALTDCATAARRLESVLYA